MRRRWRPGPGGAAGPGWRSDRRAGGYQDRKSTRLNSSHLVISYAVFCLKKKKEHDTHVVQGGSGLATGAVPAAFGGYGVGPQDTGPRDLPATRPDARVDGWITRAEIGIL